RAHPLFQPAARHQQAKGDPQITAIAIDLFQNLIEGEPGRTLKQVEELAIRQRFDRGCEHYTSEMMKDLRPHRCLFVFGDGKWGHRDDGAYTLPSRRSRPSTSTRILRSATLRWSIQKPQSG